MKNTDSDDLTHILNAVIERDETYAEQLRSAIARTRQGKLPRRSYGRVQSWLARAALKRYSKTTGIDLLSLA